MWHQLGRCIGHSTAGTAKEGSVQRDAILGYRLTKPETCQKGPVAQWSPNGLCLC